MGSLAVPMAFAPQAPAPASPAADVFPSHPPELVKEMVTVAHGNLKRVREMLDARPALARAAWDWGFGDWETALGAASHVGNRPIAELLIANGARPSLFSATMLGQLDVVKAMVAANPGAQRIPGPHSISLLAHAKAGGEAARGVLEYLTALGDADAPPRVPLSDEDLKAVGGTYAYGTRPNEQIVIAVDRGQVAFTRTGTMTRGLVHLGNRVFHPVGAAAVRIRFTETSGSMTLTVHDPDVIVTATRA